MTKEAYNNYLDAVDIVCLNCVKECKLNCEKCAVRYTVDYLNKKAQKNLSKTKQ